MCENCIKHQRERENKEERERVLHDREELEERIRNLEENGFGTSARVFKEALERLKEDD